MHAIRGIHFLDAYVRQPELSPDVRCVTQSSIRMEIVWLIIWWFVFGIKHGEHYTAHCVVMYPFA